MKLYQMSIKELKKFSWMFLAYAMIHQECLSGR